MKGRCVLYAVLLFSLIFSFDSYSFTQKLSFARQRKLFDSNESFDKSQTVFTATKVFVGNLPFSITDNEIRNIIKNLDIDNVPVAVSIPRGKKSGRGLGYAFIDFPDLKLAESIVSALHGYSYQGRLLNSNIHEGKGSSEKRSKKRVLENSVYLSNLDFSLTEIELVNMCDDILGPGLVLSVERPLDVETGKPRRFAYIEFKESATVQRAVQDLNCLMVLDRELKCEEMKPREVLGPTSSVKESESCPAGDAVQTFQPRRE